VVLTLVYNNDILIEYFAHVVKLAYMSKNCFIGTSGWFYGHWYGNFYPAGLPKNKLLGHYAGSFKTVELNNTFYHLPKEKTVKTWELKVPQNFLFSVKASRFITHIKRLKGIREPLKLFLKRAGLLKGKLGPILFQLPPSLRKDNELLEGFLKVLPRDHDFVMEFRDKGWLKKDVFKILKRYGVALCIASMPNLPVVLEATAPFSYVRMHGGSELYGSNYTKRELNKWALNIKRFLKDDLDVYIYFNNDARGYAVKNAMALKEILGM